MSLNQAMTMVFVNKKDTAHDMQKKLKARSIEAKVLTSNLDHAERDKLMDDFRRLKFTTLISTNVLARGIDVPEVDLVISFDVPFVVEQGCWKEPDYANYMHRVGRTGRFGTDGISVQVTCHEDEINMMEKIKRHYDIEINQLSNFNELVDTFKQLRDV